MYIFIERGLQHLGVVPPDPLLSVSSLSLNQPPSQEHLPPPLQRNIYYQENYSYTVQSMVLSNKLAVYSNIVDKNAYLSLSIVWADQRICQSYSVKVVVIEL